MPVSTATDDFSGVSSQDLAPPFMTFEEFLEWTSETTWAEWVNGKVIFLMARNRHQRIADFLQSVLQEWANRTDPGGVAWSAPYPMRCLPNTPAREPDVFFVSGANQTRVKETFIDGAADIAVEIISPDSVRRDRVDKFAEYEAGGVGEYWIIDPDGETVEFYVRENGSPRFVRALPENRTDSSGGVYRSPTFSGLVIHVDWFWQDAMPSLFDIFPPRTG